MTIRKIDATVLRNNLSDTIKDIVATKRPIVVNQRNRPKVVMIDIDDYEDYLASQDPSYRQEIAQARRELVEGKGVPLSQLSNEFFGSIEK